MKILHYLLGLPPVRSGGLVKYALDLVAEEKAIGHKVYLLVPGKIDLYGKKRIKITKSEWNDITCYRIQNPLPVIVNQDIREVKYLYNRGDKEIYKQFINELNPDVVHIHSFMGLHIAFLEAAKELGIQIVYTTHDYYGLCIKATLLKDDHICQEDNWGSCPNCQRGKAGICKLAWEQSKSYKYMVGSRLYRWLISEHSLAPLKGCAREMLEKLRHNNTPIGDKMPLNQDTKLNDYDILRKYYREMFGYIDKFHFNSVQTKNVYIKYLDDLRGTVIGISNRNISDNRVVREYTDSNPVRIGFIGYLTQYKGFPLLKSALDELYVDGARDFECHVFVNPSEKPRPYMKCHAGYMADDMQKIYENIDVLVLPSVWQETFGMVVLEALSYGVPVVVSDNVGAKDILLEHEGMGIIVKTSKENLKETISDLIQHREKLRDMNKAICNWKHDFSFENHVRDIIKFYG